MFWFEKYNKGVLLTEERITTINKWINEHDKNSKQSNVNYPSENFLQDPNYFIHYMVR